MADRHPGLKFGLFAVICLVCAAWLVQVTGNVRFFADTVGYQAELRDVSGLSPRDSVMLAGVRVGSVEAIRIERGVAVVDFQADRDLALRTSWEVGLRWRNVLGQRYLYLFPVGDGDVLEQGARIPVEQSRPTADIGLFFERLTPLLRAIDPEQQNVVIRALNEALEGNEARLQELTGDLASLTGTLADHDEQVRGVLDQGTALLDTYARRSEQIELFLSSFADVSRTLAARNDELVGAVDDIGRAQVELGRLLEANDVNLRSSLDDIDTITATLGRHTEDLERAVATLRDGFGTYMLISRWGQWFNVRAVAVQVQDDGRVIYCRDEGNQPCSRPNGGPVERDEPRAGAPDRLSALDAVVGAALGSAPGDGVRRAAARPGGGGA